MQCILLMGMPGSGKSVVGRKVAEILGYAFFDGDSEIAKLHPDRQGFLDENGDDGYMDMETKVLTGLPLNNSVLAPGGSFVYSEKAVNYFSGCFKVHLNVSLGTVKKRLSKCMDERGIVRLKKVGIAGLYLERQKVYAANADFALENEGFSVDEVAGRVVSAYCMHSLAKPVSPVKYVSTNGRSTASFADALFMGLAPDSGLFMPEVMRVFTKEEINLMAHLDYAKLAFVILRQFVDIGDSALLPMCIDAYDFDLPVEKHGSLFIVRFDCGPSASFKDFGAQMLSRMMAYFSGKSGKNLKILTATSGDTGAAVAAAFGRVKGAKVFILMPENEITVRQRKQMTTAGDGVVSVLVGGKFDDCQALVKKAFSKLEGFSSANSINVGRLLPQMVYYFYIYCRTAADTIVVPSGNFGNLVAGVMAKKMGLPVRLVAAVNENDGFPRFLRTGSYAPISPSIKCISNAMNVGNPSNLARLVWLYGGRLDEGGKIKVLPDMESLRKDVLSVSITDGETRAAMKQAFAKGITLEPHGAVGWAAIQKLRNEQLGKTVLFETAHPAKFPEILDSLGIPYAIPDSLAGFESLEEHFVRISPDLDELKSVLNG